MIFFRKKLIHKSLFFTKNKKKGEIFFLIQMIQKKKFK